MTTENQSNRPAETEPGHQPEAPEKQTPAWRPFLRRALIGLGALLALPYVIAIAYAVFNPPYSALMLIRGMQGHTIDYRWVDLDKIAAILPATVIMREDARFCLHHGVDWGAVREVIKEVEDGKPARGASTITMQLTKNLFLWNGRSYLRKALEVPLAMWIDLIWSKRRIIEIYLNVVEWGPGIYGAEAAARHHFKRASNKLTSRQAALLTAALPDPLGRKAGKPGRLTQRLAASAAKRARAAGPWIKCLHTEKSK